MAAPLPPWVTNRIIKEVRGDLLDESPEVPISPTGGARENPEARTEDTGSNGSEKSVRGGPVGGVGRGGHLGGSGNGSHAPLPSFIKTTPKVAVPERVAGVRQSVGAPALPSFISGDSSTPRYDRSRAVARKDVASVGGFRFDKEIVRRSVVYKVKSYYDHLFGRGASAGTSIQYNCPFHDDKSPSLSVSKETGGWACHSGDCGEKGDVFTAWMKIKNLSFGRAIEQIAEWAGDPAAHPVKDIKVAEAKGRSVEITDKRVLRSLAMAQRNIVKSEEALLRLRSHYGITKETAVRVGLGYDGSGGRLWIPVYHKNKLVAIRKHDILRKHCCWIQGDPGNKNNPPSSDFKVTGRKPPDPENWKVHYGRKLCRKAKPIKQGGKVIGITGHNGITLYPSSRLGAKKMNIDDNINDHNNWIVLTGGELKAIYLNQQEIPAVTFTGGEGKFTAAWLKKFSGLDVEVCMDSDKAGIEGANKVAEALTKYARRVRIIDLPHGDVNDYYRSRGWDFGDWLDLPRRPVKDSSRRTSKMITFNRLRDASLVNDEVQFRAIVAGSGETPFFVPNSVKAVCNKGQVNPIKMCQDCKLAGVGFESEVVIPSEDLIEIRSKGTRRQLKHIRQYVLGIPEKCHAADIKTSSIRIAEIGLVKDVDTINEWNEEDQGNWFVQKVYYVDKGDIPENEPVQCFGKIIADPIDSRSTMVLRRMSKLRRAHESAAMSLKTKSLLESVSGGNDSPEDIVTRMGWYADEFSERITHIYQQNQLILGSLILWFMPLRFKLFGKVNEKISAEVLLLGDTRAGKTSVGKAMLRHFKAGRFVQCEGATFAGLVGGSGEHGSKKFFTWGVLPSQDGGFVLMDEIDDIVRSGVFGQLTSIRSDGVASRVIAGGVRQASSRLRMLMASNPLGNRRMKTYSSTMFAINELLKSPQDVARFEYAIGVYRPDDPNIFSKKPDDMPTPYRSEYAAEHVRWAWRQRPELSGLTADHVMNVSTDVSTTFNELTLLTASEARWKVARIACAIAALCYSVNDVGLVDVKPEHVEVAGMFLKSIYGSQNFAYTKFAKDTVVDSDELRMYMIRLGAHAVKFMRENDSFSNDMIETIVDAVSNRREFMKIMMMSNKCIRRYKSGYIKTQGFKDFLERISNER